MSQQLKEEIKTRTKEIYDLENRLQSLQIAQSAPVADGFSSAVDFIEATRDYHQAERDRLGELSAIEQFLPSARVKLKDLQDRFDGIKSPVEQHFGQFVAIGGKIFKRVGAGGPSAGLGLFGACDIS